MTPDSFKTMFLNICTILHSSPLDNDIAAAISFAQDSAESLREALDAGAFNLNELMWLMVGAIAPDFADPVGRALESDLAVIVAHVGPDVARRTYRDKLLVNDAKTLEDTRYEIAVTSKVCVVLDSVQLEKPISDASKQQKHWKNTDIYGTFHGDPVRIEVTVLHEDLSGVVHPDLDDLVKAAATSFGFSIALRTVLLDEGYAGRVRALLELLAEAHGNSGGKDEEIDGIRFEWRRGAYHCEQATSPFQSIVFHRADELPGSETIREITHPVSVRSVTPKFILEDHPNPPGVITSADLPDAPTQVPVSTKVHQMLAGKLQQCEQGVVNIIAFGNPLPMHDRDVASAVLGAEVVSIPFTEDENGLHHFGKAELHRNPKAPFAPAQCLANDDDRREFVDPFRKMSAVWRIRLGTYARSVCFPNPNASHPAKQELLAALSDPPIPTQAVDRQSTEDQDAGSVDSDAEQQNEEIVWPEMAQEFICVCGRLEEAKLVLEQLKMSGLSLEELRSKMDQFWSEDSGKKEGMRFVSPSNEQMGMQFVIDCGGYEQAKACLEEVAEDSQTGSDNPHE